MKKKIVIGSIVSIIILMMVPSIPAVKYNTAIESNKAQIFEQIKKMNIDELREKIKNLDFQELKEKIKNIGHNERMQFLQSFIKSSHNKSGILNFFLALLYLLFTWIISIPYMLMTYHIILPFWFYLFLIWLALYVA